MAKLHLNNMPKKLHTSKGDVNLNAEKMNELAKKLFDTICDFLPESLKDSIEINEGIANVEISAPQKNGQSQYKIDIKIPDEYLKRDSLYKEGYPDGVDNIINLFDKGYKAKRYAYGYWATAGMRIRSKLTRPPIHFMSDAINDFNSHYGSQYNCRAVLGDKYK